MPIKSREPAAMFLADRTVAATVNQRLKISRRLAIPDGLCHMMHRMVGLLQQTRII